VSKKDNLLMRLGISYLMLDGNCELQSSTIHRSQGCHVVLRHTETLRRKWEALEICLSKMVVMHSKPDRWMCSQNQNTILPILLDWWPNEEPIRTPIPELIQYDIQELYVGCTGSWIGFGAYHTTILHWELNDAIVSCLCVPPVGGDFLYSRIINYIY
jgi:hypothetical protein